MIERKITAKLLGPFPIRTADERKRTGTKTINRKGIKLRKVKKRK